MMQDLNDLAYFALVVEHGGFAAAERASGIPKSKLSRRLAELESQLGVRLIQRSTRRFAVTEIGQRTLQHARAMLAEAEAAQAVSAEETAEPRGTVRISCPPALLQHAVSDLLAQFLSTWPQVAIRVESTNRNVDLWHDGIDLALRVRVAAPNGAVPSQYADEVVRSLAISPHVLVAAPKLLTYAAPPSTPEALTSLPTLGLGNSTDETRWTLIDEAGTRVEVQHQPRLIADDMGTLLCATLAGVGCAVLPKMMVHEALAERHLLELLPGWAPPAGTIQAAFASRRGMRPAVRKLLDFLADGFAQLAREKSCLQVKST